MEIMDSNASNKMSKWTILEKSCMICLDWTIDINESFYVLKSMEILVAETNSYISPNLSFSTFFFDKFLSIIRKQS